MSGIGDTWNTARRAQQAASQNNPMQSTQGTGQGGIQGMQGSQGIGQGNMPPSSTYSTQSTEGYGAAGQQYGQPTMGRSTQPMSSQMGQGQQGTQGLGGQGMGGQGIREQGLGNQNIGTQGIGSQGAGSEGWHGQPAEGPGTKRGSQSSETSDYSQASEESHGDKSGGGGLLQKAKDKLSGIR